MISKILSSVDQTMIGLSIITCTYNSEKYLKECIESIKEQNITVPIEHIFVDAFSNDKTLDIIKKYKESVQNMKNISIKVIQTQPKWVYNAMNIGIKNAKGKYLLFLNSDDFLERESLNKYLQKLASDADLYYAVMYFFREDGSSYPTGNFHILRKLLGKIWFHTLFYHPTCLIKKSLFEELWYYDETKKIASDYGFWLKIIKNKKKTEYYPHLVARFRVHGESLSTSGNNDLLSIEEIKKFRIQELGIRGYCLHGIGLLTRKIIWKYM